MGVARLTKDETIRLTPSERLILYYRQDPVTAAKDLMGVDLVWFQRKILRDLWFKKYNLMLMSRGIGKTWLQALFACLYGMLFPKAHIGVITPSFKQTEFLFEKINDFYDESPFLRSAVAKRTITTYKARYNFHNGSWIEGLPLGTGEKVRGRRYNLVLIDEYAFVDEDIIKRVVRPMLKIKKLGIDNKYIISSTAYYTWNHFYAQYLLYNVMVYRKPELYGLHEYIDIDLSMVKDPPFEMDAGIEEMMKMDTTQEAFEMENSCRFPIDNVGFFSARLIDKCTPRSTETVPSSPIEVEGTPNGVYVMGIDAARAKGGDNFSISVVKIDGGIKRLVFGSTLNGFQYQEMIAEIRRVMQLFNISQISCDSGGGGTTIKDLLMQPYETVYGTVLPPILDMDDKDMQDRVGIYILRMVNFTAPTVNNLYMRLKADMQHVNLVFPIDIRRGSDKELIKVATEILETKRELLVLQAEGKGNYLQFSVPSQFRKDRATSLALAVHAANDFMDSGEENITELPNGFWAGAING